MLECLVLDITGGGGGGGGTEHKTAGVHSAGSNIQDWK
jgi:hypothetical protein